MIAEMTIHADVRAAARERILVLEGPKGTMIQQTGLDEAGFRGIRLAGHPCDIRNNNEALNISRPDLIEGIHAAFLAAGADIVGTNTFNANAISQADFAAEGLVEEMNVAAAAIARRAVDAAQRADPSRPRWVAGTLGPTNATASLAVDVENPGARPRAFEDFRRAYLEQALALLRGGVDLLIVETVFDTLVAKAALYALGEAFSQEGRSVPVLVSATIVDQSGRTLSGQTLAAFLISVAHAEPWAVGLNCSLGPTEMRPYVEELAGICPALAAAYPNAGLPNPLLPTGFDETPERMAAHLGEWARQGWLNVAGGCCGSTPEHIAAIAAAVAGLRPRVPPQPARTLRVAGLEALEVRPDQNFLMIGERTNVTGSPRFARLIREGDFEGAVGVARQQVRSGANLIDVNTDEGLLDSEDAMVRFLNLLAAEPEVARVPVMIDSSRWSVLEAGLRCLQGKGVVNSLSLKDGEDELVRRARQVRAYGAAVVLMAFDERGQADTLERKLEVCRRAYRVLTERAGFPPEDIIFDPNVLTVATGMEEHAAYGLDFIEAVRRLKAEMPLARTSGGVSNVSFSFRGHHAVREAMHAAFLYHAIHAGLDMGIVNAGQLAVYEEIDLELRELVEDVLLNRRPDAGDRLVAHAERTAGAGAGSAVRREEEWRREPVARRLEHALVCGIADHVEADALEAMASLGSALAVIEGPLMAGMAVVGDLFADGRMFLPQVVKSARVMKRAVAALTPHLQRGGRETPSRQGRIVLATVKGDVHDIGKKIVGVVLECNHYEVIDLGVMVPCERLLAAARDSGADAIGVSGLITPSLDEMRHVAREMERAGFTIPLLIGGATTSRAHTAIRIAPEYSGPVVHVVDASRAVGVASALLSADQRNPYVAANLADQEALRAAHAAGRLEKPLIPVEAARARREPIEWRAEEVCEAPWIGARQAPVSAVEALVPFIDWSPFFHVWELRGRFPAILEDRVVGARARDLYDDGKRMLDRLVRERALEPRGVYGFFPASGEGDDIVIFADVRRTSEIARVHCLRQQSSRSAGEPHRCLADYVAPRATGLADSIGAFAVTAGHGLERFAAARRADHDDYGAILAEALADRLAEAFAEMLHRQARADWGYGAGENLSAEDLIRERYRGIRPAPGYPACPDHTQKRTLFALLDVERATGITLTESLAMHPASSVSGWYLAHPAARYFPIGRIGRDQVVDYAARRGVSVAEAERWLAPNLNYEPAATA
ncbi:MAG TPA: methionine synthase [Chthonomonadales bacterium]|nr:methionine synthase [Chthonomonadales bacterium]